MLRRLILLLFMLLLTACVAGYSPPPEVLSLTASVPPRPTFTPTPEAVLDQPPELRDPEHLTQINLDSQGVNLAWIFYRDLEPGEVFEVLAGREGGNLEHVIYSQSNGVNVTDWFRIRQPGWYHWTVRIMKRRDQPDTFRQISYSAEAYAVEVTGTSMATPVAAATDEGDFVAYLPDGFRLDVYAETEKVGNTVLLFGPDNALYVLNLDGTIRRVRDENGDGFGETVEIVYADEGDVLKHAAGMAFHDDGRLFVSDSGRISQVMDSDNNDRLDTVTPIVEGLPTLRYPFHSNNGIAFGPDGKLYIAVGATTDHGPLYEPLEASILRVNDDGSDLEVFASGFRNPYDLAFTMEGDLFSADNAPDILDKTMRYLPPEELNHVREGLNYGFPDVYGALIPADNNSEPPLVEFYPSVVTAGIAYYGGGPFPSHYHRGMFVAQFGTGAVTAADRAFDNGHAVVYVELVRQDDATYTGDFEDFVQFRRDAYPRGNPIDVTVGPRGNLYISESQTGEIYIVTYPGTGA